MSAFARARLTVLGLLLAAPPALAQAPTPGDPAPPPPGPPAPLEDRVRELERIIA